MLAVAQGKANAQIAAELYMSLATVKAHISHILDEAGAWGTALRSHCWRMMLVSPDRLGPRQALT